MMAQTGTAGKDHLAEKFENWQGKRRVLVLYAPAASHPEYVKQLRMLDSRKDGLAERDLVQVALTDGETDAEARNYLEKELGVRRGEFNLVLVGKDGGVKYRSQQATETAEIFSTIDAMPMRQNEIRQQGKQE
jgi:hypothetical protein